ncbi:MAG: alpha/beta hydrolase [Candidatus Obscuribacterales bacterium]|nr:alpha/beta hydrolase [Candidatus Obscuribacterales bacterium]
MPRIDSSIKLEDGRKLGYATLGAPDGQELLYMHGGMSSRLDINFADEMLHNLDVKVIAPDRPGIGNSDRQIGRTLSDWATDARQLLIALNLKNLPVLGWSLGGPYALACGALLSDRISRVATIGGVGPLDYDGAVDDLGLLEDRILLSWPETLLHLLSPAGFLFNFYSPVKMKSELLRAVKNGPDYEIIQSLTLEDATSFAFEAIKHGFEGTLDDYLALRKPWGFTLDSLQTPVIMFQGTEDNLCPVSAAKILAARIPKADLVLVEKSGHFLLHRHLSTVIAALFAE